MAQPQFTNVRIRPPQNFLHYKHQPYGVGKCQVKLQKKITETDGKARKGINQEGGFSSRQLIALAGMVVLSAMGLVSGQDSVFVAYVYFLSKVAFPTLSPRPNSSVFGERKRLLSLYVKYSEVISFVFPVPYILEGFLQGDKDGIKAGASHVFLLASQILMEGVAFHGGFSMPVFVFVPVLYNSRRIFTIMEWFRGEISKVGGSPRRKYTGTTLAAANMAFWCFNLFGFLLPVFLPKVFKLYYSAHKALN